MSAPATALDAPPPALRVLLQVRAARGLLSEPERWTRGATARDDQGRIVLPWDPRAACWCLLGAIRRYGVVAADAERLLDAVAAELFGCRAPLASDRHGHVAALRIYDRAIALMEAKL